MTALELIQKLLECPPDAEVVIGYEGTEAPLRSAWRAHPDMVNCERPDSPHFVVVLDERRPEDLGARAL